MFKYAQKLINELRTERKARKFAKKLEQIVKTSIVCAGGVVTPALAILSSPQPVYAQQEKQENDQRKLLRQNNITNLKLDPRFKYKSLMQGSLNLQKDFGNPETTIKTIDNVFDKINKKVKLSSEYNKKEEHETLKQIATRTLIEMDEILKEEKYFRTQKTNILIQAMKKRASGERFLDCDDYTWLYLVAGERIGIDLEPVYTPGNQSGHMFLKCNLPDNTHFYWEPTIAQEKNLEFYRQYFGLPENSFFPKVLDDREFYAIQLCNIGVAWYEKEEYETAIEYYENSISLNPNYAPAYNNRGNA